MSVRCKATVEYVARTGYCLYGDHASHELTVEHLLPADIGAGLKLPACAPCNARAARLVDRPLSEFPDVAALCAMHDVRNERHRSRRRRYELAGALNDGSRALYRPHAAQDLRQVTISTAEIDDEGSFTYALPADDPEPLRRGLRRRLEEEHPGRTISFEDERVERREVVFKASREVRACLWPRLSAKVTLGLADLLFDASWRDSYTAYQLRSIFLLGRSLEGVRAHELPLTVIPDQLDDRSMLFATLAPWEHLLTLTADGEALGLRGVLFGELAFEARFACDLTWDGGTQAWLFDARAFTCQHLPLGELSRRITERVALFGFAAGLHRDRPRGQVLRVPGADAPSD